MADLDLNLLKTFVSIYETRSLTQTAAEMCITQPSVSHALSRLRRQLGDPLFTRGAGGMTPTQMAVELFSTFKASLNAIDLAIDGTRDFDPTTSSRTFRLCLSDLGEMAFLPALMKRLLDSAPQIVLEVVPMQIDRVPEWLAHGAVDAAIASVPIGGAARSRVIDQEHYVCVLPDREGGNNEIMTLAEFAAMRHVVIDQSAGHHLAEAEIAALGIERNIALRLHHFSVLPLVLAGQNLAAIVPSRVARMFTEKAPLSIRELPFHVPPFDVSLYWNGTAPRSQALQWFHETIADSLN